MSHGAHQSARSAARVIQKAAKLRQKCRCYATEAPVRGDLFPQPGETLHGFTLKRVKEVPELQLAALQFQHDKTGGEYMHLAKDDRNNVFSIGFKTNPPDHTGVPHILEHLTLCGSQKYPVRDPFFKMMPRSLNNFMNAMTYPDHTVYPYATTNPQDFKNLMSVYLDATLHPLLRKHDFAQEGWRVGPQDPKAASSTENPLVFKGVVYNEMKGVMSNADNLFRTRWQNNILPTVEDSGGDPQKMTNLTYAQLCNFQKEHYNPSNARIFTYGNIPFQDHLQQLGPALARFDRRKIASDVKAPIDLSNSPQKVTVLGPSDPLYPKDQQYKASVSWIMGDTTDVLEDFSLTIITSLLLEGFSSPVYKNTIDIGWGASYAPNTGYDSSAGKGIFTVGLSGLKKHDVMRLNSGLRYTLENVGRIGFDPSKIDGRLAQIELDLKHKTADFGMGITTRLLDGSFNGTDPFDSVSPEETVSAFREKSKDPQYLLGLFKKYFLTENTFTFVMEPTESFGEEIQAEEASRLAKKISDVTKTFPSLADATKSLEAQERELLDVQESGGKEDLSCLPTVHVKDIPRQAERKDLRFSTLDNSTKVQWREASTNGLTYFRALQPLKDLPDELRIYLPLFSSAIHRLGPRGMTVEQFEDTNRLYTGGIGVNYHASTSPLDLNICNEGLVFGGTTLDRNVPQMYELLRRLVQETDFSRRDAEEKLNELIKSSASSALNDVADTGHSYARRFAEAGLSSHGRLIEETQGLTQIRLMMDLAGRASHDGLPDVIDKMKAIQSFMLSADGGNLRVALTCNPESSAANEAALQSFLSSIQSAKTVPAPTAPDTQIPYPRHTKTFFPLPYQVYYAAHATRTVPYTHADSAPLAVLAQLLTHKRLHPDIREKGGAYGASSYLSAARGTFGFATYRDPNPLNSLGVMADTGAWAEGREWTEREVEEAKLSVFQNVDAPQSVSEEGLELFLRGVEFEMEQERRERLLDVTAAQVRDVAGRYVVEGKQREKNSVLLGEKKEGVGEEKDGWTEMPLNVGEAVEEKGDDYLVI